ncbi:MAG: sulfatase-like hydrolase/transferase [Thermoanaerobaculia bacterium]|nr:sulfatase-like hydrolase/transferase [Thermoanaerobaculia bacterium]
MSRLSTCRTLGCALALGLALACGSHRDAVSSGPIRLVEGPPGTVVEWPQPDRSLPDEFLTVDIGSLPAPGRLAYVVMHREDDERDARLAMVAPGGSHHRFPVSLPVGKPSLEFALGYALEPLVEDATLRFQIDVVDPKGRSNRLLDETVSTREGSSWLDRRLSLEAWSGQRVTLEFSVESPAEESLWPAWGTPEIVDTQEESSGPNLILIVLDTLRADHLGAYGYERPTSPFLDRWSTEGTRFATAISQSSWTRPSHLSLFSGLYPTSRVGLSSPPLAEVLWRQGYRTSALTGGAQLSYRFGFSRGFETHRIERWVRQVDSAVAELERNRTRQNFLFLHTYEIHDPYQHTELADGLDRGRLDESFERATLATYGKGLTATEREYATALYDSGIRYVDGQLESLFAQLEARGLLDNTLVVITSDHGEELWDHGGWGHGHAMFDHQTHVPLILHLPPSLRAERHLEASKGGVIDQQVRLVDLYPTLLDLLGIPMQHQIHGRSVVPMLAGRRMSPADAFSESTYWGPLEVKSLRAERYKLMTATPKNTPSDRPGWTVLFDLQADPAELRDIAADEEQRRQKMQTILDLITAGGGEAEEAVPSDLDPELEEQLRALGYID